jgi:ribonuclease Z
MKLQFIGTGVFTAKTRALTSFLINDEVLFDAGGGTMRGLQQLGADFTKIKYLVISHFHIDHLPDAFNFLMRRRLTSFEHLPLTIVGPTGVERVVLDAMDKYMGPIFKTENLTFVELAGDRGGVQLNGYEIIAHSVKHGFCQPANAYEIITSDRHLGFSGDATKCDGLDAVVANSEVLFVDSTDSGVSNDWHLNMGGALEYARTFPDKKFYLIHRDDYKVPADLPPNVFAPDDSDVIEL